MSPDVRNELSQLTVARLRSLASELEIKGRSRMRKAELVEALSEAPGIGDLLSPGPAATGSPTPSVPTRPPREAAGEEVSASPSRSAAGGSARPVASTPPRGEAVASPPARSPRAGGSPEASGATGNGRGGVSAPTPIPSGTGAGSLGILVVDPTCVFVFWDVDEELIARARDCVGDPQGALVLRTYGVAASESPGGSVRGRFDLFVEAARGEHYLKVPDSGRSLSCELGVESRDGRFHAFAWSNDLCLPGDRQPPARGVRRMRIGGEPSSHWPARGAAASTPPESIVVAAEAALPTEESARAPDHSVAPTSGVYDAVVPSGELDALLESAGFSVETRASVSSAETVRRLRRGLSSGALGVSSTRVNPKEASAGRAGEAPDASRLRIVLPGLVAAESGTD